MFFVVVVVVFPPLMSKRIICVQVKHVDHYSMEPKNKYVKVLHIKCCKPFFLDLHIVLFDLILDLNNVRTKI